MSAAIDAIKLAWRDFITDGVPASGENEPAKAEIRAAFDLLETEISAVGNGLLRYETKALLDANVSATDGQLAYVWGDGTAENNTVYQSDGGTWTEATWYFDAVAAVVQPLVDDAEAAAAAAAADAASVAGVTDAVAAHTLILTGYDDVETSYGPTPIDAAETNTGTQVRSMATPIAASGTLSEISVWCKVAGDVQIVISSLSGGTSTAEIVIEQTLTESTTEPFTFDPGETVEAGWYIGIFSKTGVARVAGGVPGLFGGGIGASVTVSETFPANEHPTVGPLIGYKITAPRTVASDVSSLQAQIDSGLTASGTTPTKETAYETGTADLEQGSYTVDIPALEIRRPSGTLTVNAQEMTFAAPTSGTFTDVATPFVTGTSGENLPGDVLVDDDGEAFQYYTGLVVRTASGGGGSLLVLNTDYAVRSNTDRIWRLAASSTGEGTVYASGTKQAHRYDVVVADPDTGALSVVAGTDRFKDPEFYIPAVPEGKIHLYNAYVTRHGVELIQVHKFNPLTRWPVGMEGQFAEWKAYCRQALPKLFAKMYRGEAITIIGYGESTTAMGSATSPLEANGERDRSGFDGLLGTDTEAGTGTGQTFFYTRYDETDPDFTDRPAASTYVKTGWNWYLKAEIERRFGCDVTYRNWGEGGTNPLSTAVDEPNDIYNGSHPTRLNAMLADGGDLMVIAFGINNWAQANNYAAMKVIIEAFQDEGGEVIVLPPPQVNRYGAKGLDTSEWLYVHDQFVRVALETGAAYVPLNWLEGPGNEGSYGLARANKSNSGLYHHQYPVQTEAIGKMLAQIVV